MGNAAYFSCEMRPRSSREGRRVFTPPRHHTRGHARRCGLLVFLVFLVFFFVLATSLAQSGSARDLLVAESWDEDPQRARAYALSELSNTIFATVKSDTRSSTVVENQAVDRTDSVDIRIESQIELRGVQPELADRRDQDGLWKATARLTDQAYRTTVAALAQELPPDVDALKKTEQNKALIRVEQLLALLALGFAPEEIANYRRLQEEALATRQALQKRLGALGWVRFIPPSSIPFDDSFAIYVDETLYRPNEKIFLTPGPHLFRIEAPGFRPETGRLRIRSQRETRQKLSLIAELPASAAVAMRVVPGSQMAQRTHASLVPFLENELLEFGIQIDPQAALVLSYETVQSEQESYNVSVRKLEFFLRAEEAPGGRVLAAQTVNKTTFGGQGDDGDTTNSSLWRTMASEALSGMLEGDGLRKLAAGATGP